MALVYVSTGGVYKRIGRIAARAADLIALMGGTATSRVTSGASMQTAGTNIEADAAESPAISVAVDGHWTSIAGWQSTQQSYLTQLATLAQNVLIKQVDLDANLTQKTLEVALKEMIRQMRLTGDDINDSTISVGAQTSVSSPVGTPIIVLHMKDTHGYSWQMPYAETLRFECTGDANTGATARQESFSVKGQAAAASVFTYDWPKGSGCAGTLNLVDAQKDNTAGNKLYNGDMESFASDSSHTPQDWTGLTGTAGTDFTNGGASAYTLTGCLQFTGGATLTKLYQEFNKAHSTTAGAGGTPATLKANTRYAFCCFVKVSAVPATGILRVALTDSSNTVITDDSGTSQSFNITLTAATTSYVAYTGTFITPANLPSTVRLQLGLTTALESGKNAFIDDVAFAEATSLYSGGPAVAVFAGATNCILADKYTVAITNTMGAVASWCERFFSLNAKQLIIPYDSAAGETIADSVIA